MESWFILAILSAILFGLNNFIKKIVAKKGLDKNNFVFYFAFVQVIASALYFIYMGSYFYMTALFGILVFIRRILGVEKNLTMIESLKYIDSSLFFPVHKLIKIGGGLIVGMFLFGEFLGRGEIIFLSLGFISVLLLGYKKGTFKNKDIRKGIMYLLLSSLIIVITSTINKYIGENHDPAFYVFLSSVIGFIYIGLKIKLGKKKFSFDKTEFIYGLYTGIIGFFAFLFLILALKDGKLVMVQLIATIDIIIPIVLSFILLKEDVNKIKIIGLVLFLLNLGCFYLNIR
ncbi:MAG: DMT family transporter [Candidatus Gracilibacteria bacterium]